MPSFLHTQAIIIKAARATLSDVENGVLTDTDAMLISRGYSAYTPRQEETNKAFGVIATWRTANNYHDFLRQNLPQTTTFHQHWEERTYVGRNKQSPLSNQESARGH